MSMKANDFSAWLRQAKPREICEYYSGHLAKARGDPYATRSDEQLKTDELAQLVWSASTAKDCQGLVELTQRKSDSGYVYRAQRTFAGFL